jgi:hypothetical protein
MIKSPSLHVFWAIGLMATLVFSCAPSAESTDPNTLDSIPTVADADGELGDSASAMPSPIQMAINILNSQAPFNGEMLNPPTKADGYSNTFTQSINLGIYQADLGYLIAHHQTQDALNYFEAVKKLGDKLGIFGAFEQPMIDRAKKNLDSRDSLFAIVTEAFKNADQYFDKNAMAKVADVVAIGGWLESTYLATQSLKTHDSGPLRKRIGDDKAVLPQLLATINLHKGSKDHEALATQLAELNTLYDAIKIKRNYKPSETDEQNKVTKIKSATKVRYTKETLQKITDKIASIRNNYVH